MDSGRERSARHGAAHRARRALSDRWQDRHGTESSPSARTRSTEAGGHARGAARSRAGSSPSHRWRCASARGRRAGGERRLRQPRGGTCRARRSSTRTSNPNACGSRRSPRSRRRGSADEPVIFDGGRTVSRARVRSACLARLLQRLQHRRSAARGAARARARSACSCSTAPADEDSALLAAPGDPPVRRLRCDAAARAAPAEPVARVVAVAAT